MYARLREQSQLISWIQRGLAIYSRTQIIVEGVYRFIRLQHIWCDVLLFCFVVVFTNKLID